MKAAHRLLFGLALATSAIAQELPIPEKNEGVSDVVQNAIDEFNRLKQEGKEKSNEVVVVLDPPASAVTVEDSETPAPEAALEPAEAEETSKPVLVTGKPPGETETEEKEGLTPETVAEAETQPEEPQEPETPAELKLEVRVESIRKGSGSIDPGQVKLKASFPAKPLSSAPEGCVLERSDQAPLFRKEVELQPGTSISLSIQPHVLTPAADGTNTFSVGEPGFEAAQGYLQKNTVSAILGTSVAQLDHDSLQLGNAISELHRLLASLPKPEEPEKP